MLFVISVKMVPETSNSFDPRTDVGCSTTVVTGIKNSTKLC